MKKLLITTMTAGALLLCRPASANPINILGVAGDYPANDISLVTGNTGLGGDNVLAWLQSEASQHTFAAPTTTLSYYPISGAGGPIAAGDYLVLHYGVGSSGTPGTGGGLVALYFESGVASFTVPATGSGPNGAGGISTAYLYDHGSQVPDQGMTLIMMSLGLLGIGLFAKIKNKGRVSAS